MMSFEDAIKPSRGGVMIDFDVSPGAKKTVVPSGYSEWRKRIEVKIRAPPEKGRANEELIETLSTLFNVPSSNIEIASGATNSLKSVIVYGLGPEDVAKALRDRL